MQHYLQTNDDPNVFEEVDEFTFKHRSKAINDDEKPRYTGNYFTEDGGDVCLYLDKLTAKQLGIVARILSADAPGSYPGGFCREPQSVKFKMGQKLCVRMGGKNFIQTTRWVA